MHRPLIALLLPLLAFAFSPAPASGGDLVALVSDLEGDIGRFRQFLAGHEAFAKGPDGLFHLRPGARFVYGGDVPDRFFGERALLRELLRLKGEAPDRVFLIAGNRDVNKLRLPLELSGRALVVPPRRHPRAYASWCAKHRRPDAAGSRLRWILEQTMGAPEAFDLRRRELAAEEGVDPSSITEQDVVDSYLADAAPDGLFHRYLRCSQLAARIGQTLIVHAGIPQAALAHIPGEPERASSLDLWLEKLDRWYRSHLREWETRSHGWDGNDEPPGNALLRYVEKWGQQPANPFSVTYGRTVDPDGKVCLPPEPVITWLQAQGINRLVVGHTPSGQVPVILRTLDGTFELLVLDTSYGLPDSIPLVSLEGAGGRMTVIRATLEIEPGKRLPIDFSLELGLSGPVGRTRSDRSVMIAPSGDHWLTYRLEPGYKVRYDLISGGDTDD